MRTLLAGCVLAAVLSGCPETESCPPGTAAPIGDDGKVIGECVPIDGGADAGDAGDGGDGAVDGSLDASDSAVDAGPCGMECVGGEPYCDETLGECVACLMDSHCGDAAAAKCGADGACGACDMSAQCAGISGTEVCAMAGDNAGGCVECAAGEVDACGGNPCTMGNACSAFGTAQDTCEACDTDDNCGETDHFCVPMEYPAGTARDGGHCLKATPGCARPLTIVIAGRTSLSGVTGQSYCGVNETLTTCEAVEALLADTLCPGGMDSECPEGGSCQTLDPTGAALANRCTYACSGPTQCDVAPNPGSNCDDGGGTAGDYCGG